MKCFTPQTLTLKQSLDQRRGVNLYQRDLSGTSIIFLSHVVSWSASCPPLSLSPRGGLWNEIGDPLLSLGGTSVSPGCLLSYPHPLPDTQDWAEGAIQKRYVNMTGYIVLNALQSVKLQFSFYLIFD